MSYWGYNNENKKQISNKYVFQVSNKYEEKRTLQDEATEKSMPEILELVHNTHDIVLLTRAFYLLGLYLLSEESDCDKIIKSQYLYDKILIVLNCGLQTKVCIALDLISALLFFGGERGYSRRQTLQIYARSMIKTSGCLDAMCNLFTNCMMQRVTLRALCSSLSLAARDAQAHCSHLVPQCVQRCRQGQSETFSLLQTLLYRHDRNIQVFHESNGMTIFTRESFQHPECLHLLNTLAENATPRNVVILSKSYEVFEVLRRLLSKYGSDSLVGKWALIILHSHQKAIKTSKVNNVGNNKDTADIYEQRVHVSPWNDETSQLLRNVYREIMTLQNINNSNAKKTNINCRNAYKDDVFRMNRFTDRMSNLPDIKCYKDKSSSPAPLTTNTNDLSFSFLKHQNTDKNINTKTRHTGHIKIRRSNMSENTQLNGLKYYHIEHKNLTRSELESNFDTLEFKPPFVSTPKQRTRLTHSPTSRSLTTLSIKKDKLNRKVQKVYKTKHLIKMPHREKQNKSMTSKFFDLVNGSCTTLVRSFANIKNIFFKKTSEVTAVQTDSCSYSFTKYMKKRDAYLRDIENSTILAKPWSEETNNCSTCNDTARLRHKLASDEALRRTIQKLKLGINLYGCNFKKISRVMWPRETWMTPAVLYNLYRKLIVK